MTICLTGMHRSGTSLMSSYLERCGINMGENLVGAMRGNERGHFEDANIVQLHDDILSDNGCHMYTPGKSMHVADRFRDRARTLLDEKQNSSEHFGWKDPRSSLFLSLWDELIPDCRYILLYRPPFSVIDSLRRRGTDRRIKIFPWLPASAWLAYNEAIFKFHHSHPDSSILVNIDGFNQTHVESRAVLSDFLGYGLDTDYTDVYHQNEIAKTPSDTRKIIERMLDCYYNKRLNSLYETLESSAAIDAKGPKSDR